jgi:hypothetical protein
MRTYVEALTLAGTKTECSTSGGRTRYLTWDRLATTTPAVEALLFGTPVVTFWPDFVEIRTAGFLTPTTFDGIAAAIFVPRCEVGTRKRVPLILGHVMGENMRLDYEGRVLYSGRDLGLAPARKRREEN